MSKFNFLFCSVSSEISPTADKAMAKRTDQKTVAESPSSFEALSHMASNRFVLSPPQIGNDPHTIRTSNDSKCTHHSYLHTSKSNTVCSCTHQSTVCETCQWLKSHRTNTKEDITESFNALQVTTDIVPHPAISCRQQEAAYSNYSAQYTTLDDTTVDELAGYLEEMMYLPKPMSEMAELMYT